MALRASVIGAGIGGLTAAAALAALPGWQVTVHEQAPSLEPVGAGISLWPNALRALDTVGLGDGVRSLAALGGGNGIRRPDGTWLARSDLADALRDRFGDPLVLLTRAELLDLLRSAVPAGVLRLQSRVSLDDVTPGSDLVVAADGILSGTRRQLFPDHPAPVYAGYTAWRLLARSPGPPGAVSGSETWGPSGQRFAIVPLAAGRVYCYATASVPAGSGGDSDEKAELLRRFGAWHAPIRQILESVAPGDVLHHDIQELRTPLPSFVAGRVALLGDAAHPMVPELGQGGCQAMEDAVTLAAVLRDARSGDDVPAALQRYSQLRAPRTADIARRSRAMLRLTQATGRAGTLVRDLSARAMGVLPPTVAARGLDPVLRWSPPG